MPNIKGIDLSDGIRIISAFKNGEDAYYSKADIEAYLATHDITQAETQANKFLANHEALLGSQVRVHIFSASPLRYTCMVANIGVEIPDNWWDNGS